MKRAYTLIELMVALAIGALLVGLAVPRFTAYQQRLEFEQQARIIQECMQGAAEQAAAPSGITSGVSSVVVNLISSQDGSSCVSRPDNGSAQAAVTGTAPICKILENSIDITFQSKINYTMPVVKHGAVTSYQLENQQPVAAQGQTVFQLSDVCSNPQFTATVTIPPTGLPVQLNMVPA